MNQLRRSQQHLNGTFSKFEGAAPPLLEGPRSLPVASTRLESRENRLDSWKAIAVYLDREVRTVQRWEKRERLPVHRHLHHKVGSIFAFKNEIDHWRKSRWLSPDHPVSNESKPDLAAGGSLVLSGLAAEKELTPLARFPRNLSMAWTNVDSIPAIIYFSPDAIAIALRPDSRQTKNLSLVGIRPSQGRSLDFKTRRSAAAKS